MRVAHGHSLGLVVGNVDEGGVEALMQLGQLGTHLRTQLGVQVGQRLVQQEDLRATDDGAAQRNTLTLTTGQSGGLTVEQVLNFKDTGSLVDAALDLVLRGLAQLQTERHVLVHSHVRIQSVVLEHHGDVALLGRDVVAQTAVNVELAFADLFQTGDHAQGGGLTAAGRTDENDKFLVFDFEVEIGNGSDAACVLFVDMLQRNTGHEYNPHSFVFDGLMIPQESPGVYSRSKQRLGGRFV